MKQDLIWVYELDKQLHERPHEKVIGLMKGALSGVIMTGFDVLRPKTQSYLTDEKRWKQKLKRHNKKKKKEKRKLRFEDYKHCLEGT